MTDHHTSRFCSSCNRVFYSERDGTFCAACVMLAYEQAPFTGHVTINYDDYAVYIPLPADDATPTQRIDTDNTWRGEIDSAVDADESEA